MAAAQPAAPQRRPAPRTYSVEHRPQHYREGNLDWVLHLSGEGHWCIGGREAGRFASETAAHVEGRAWVETGR